MPSRPPSLTPLLPETEQQMLQDLMSEAMEEVDGQHAQGPQHNGDSTSSLLTERTHQLFWYRILKQSASLLNSCLFSDPTQGFRRRSIKTMTRLTRTSSCFPTRAEIPPKSQAPPTRSSTPPSSPPSPTRPRRRTTSVSWTRPAPEEM